MDKTNDTLERAWARLGVLFNCRPARHTPDLERLLLETARRCHTNARLLPLVVSWCSRYGYFIARHRLARLVGAELEARWRPVLALLLEEAVVHGASRDLLAVSRHCVPAVPAGPLSEAFGGDAALGAIAERNASERSKRWGVWAPEIELREEALRPASWVLERNPSLRDRAIRKGDLRASILETLRCDTPDGRVRSESELARLCGATRLATHRALAALARENEISVAADNAGVRDRAVSLRSAA